MSNAVSPTSRLWTRRMTMTNKATPPTLAPLLTMNLTSAIQRDTPALSMSTTLYTPTEASNLLLGRFSYANEASRRKGMDEKNALVYDTPFSSINLMAEELQCEIDMASLGTEMALSLFDSDSDTSAASMQGLFAVGARSVRSKPRLRLLPVLSPALNVQYDDNNRSPLTPTTMHSVSPAMSSFAYSDTVFSSTTTPTATTPSMPDDMVDVGATKGGGLPRKRARMSQEKRRRLARRREREAILLGLPVPVSRSCSAPPHKTTFSNNVVHNGSSKSGGPCSSSAHAYDLLRPPPPPPSSTMLLRHTAPPYARWTSSSIQYCSEQHPSSDAELAFGARLVDVAPPSCSTDRFAAHNAAQLGHHVSRYVSTPMPCASTLTTKTMQKAWQRDERRQGSWQTTNEASGHQRHHQFVNHNAFAITSARLS